MKKVVLSVVCLFVFSIFSNATTLAERDCVEEAIEAGDKAEERGESYEMAYYRASIAYLACEYDL